MRGVLAVRRTVLALACSCAIANSRYFVLGTLTEAKLEGKSCRYVMQARSLLGKLLITHKHNTEPRAQASGFWPLSAAGH